MSNKIIVEIRLPSGNADGFDINLEILQKKGNHYLKQEMVYL